MGTRSALAVNSASLNFAADANDGGLFSNLTPDRTDLNLQARTMRISNGRLPAQEPRLDREGMALVRHDIADPRWLDPDWVEESYVPSCIDLVKRLTGAIDAVQLYYPLVRRGDYKDFEGAAPVAEFVHLDYPRSFTRDIVRDHLEAAGKTASRSVIYNVWKCISPPPQDRPLAVCDRRSVSEKDHVPGRTVEYLENGEPRIEVPYCLISPSAEPDFFYFPDMQADETLVFVGEDLDPANPLGCAHCAFVDSSVETPTTRASIEVRVIAIFE